jgi:hypothetical protein
MRGLSKLLSFRATVFAALWMAGCGGQDASHSGEIDLRSAAKLTVQASVSPSSATAGQEVLIRLTVTATRAVTADVNLRVLKPDGSQGYTASFPGQSFTANAAKVLEDSLLLEAADPAGSYSIGAQVVRSGSTSVLFDSGALATFTVTGATAAGVNLVPVALTLSPATPQPGSAVTFSAQVKNAGGTDLIDGPLGVLFKVNGTGVVWYSVSPATTIRAGETVTLSARGGPSGTGTWTAGTAGTYSLEAVVDDLNRIVETNDSDNIMSRTFTVGTATADTTAPSVPTGLSSSNRGSTSFTLSWSASTDNVGVTGYEVFRNGTSTGTTAVPSFSVTGLNANTTYSMTVRARDAAGNWSSQSAALSVTTTVSSGPCAVSTPNVPDGPDPWGGCMPGPSNTGPNAPESSMTAYTGSCTVTTANVVIDSKIVNCQPLVVGSGASGLLIKNSYLKGGVVQSGSASFTIQDSFLDNAISFPACPDGSCPAGKYACGDVNNATINCGVDGSNYTLLRTEIINSNRAVYCHSNCLIQDNYFHGTNLWPSSSNRAHASSARVEQNTTLRHNTVACDYKGPFPNDDIGCSANITGYPDFAPIKNNTIDRNLLIANNVGVGVCAYGGGTGGKPYSNDPTNATNIKFTDNVFQRGANGNCGIWGPIIHFLPTRTGNVWSGNVWDNGGSVPSNDP